MRVIAGKYKRTILNTLEGNDTRPTKDMVKEALFSSIDIDSTTTFLDLFSGSGSIGIEAISRGSKSVIMNDINPKAVAIIKTNLAKIKERAIVYNLDWKSCLSKLEGKQFDIIFLDPPYAFNEYAKLFDALIKFNILKKDAIIIWEVRKGTTIEEHPNFRCIKEKNYGITQVLYYKEV